MTQENMNRQVCEDGKTEIAIFTIVETSNYPANSTKYTVVDGIAKNDLGWDTPMCKSASCNANVPQQVLTTIFSDVFDLIDPGFRIQGWKATSTIPPTAEYVYDKFGATPLNNPELYCTADTPTCSNIKLAEITLTDDAPFEVAICDDNKCLASVGAVDILGCLLLGFIRAMFRKKHGK
jgi:hypothetical protein